VGRCVRFQLDMFLWEPELVYMVYYVLGDNMKLQVNRGEVNAW